MSILAETKIDKSKIYFHGSSEARVEKLEAPSFQHPFYVTSDLHYAMAFCTKSQSSTGEYEVKKTFTPADQNYVYVVTLKPTCQVFDFRDKTSPEFKKLYSVIDKEIVDWVLNSADDLDFDDIYEFIIGLDQELLAKIENYSTYQQYYEASHHTSEKLIPQSVFEKAKTFAKTNGIQNVSELDIHETMAPILKKLNRLGFQGVLTKEHDYNDEVNWIHITPAKVTTDYAIGIFDKSGLDIVGLVPMRYKWLKKVNPDYWYNSTSETAVQKVKRFIQLYKKIAAKDTLVNESVLDRKTTWYFGNNRAKNLKLAPPKWHSPFFLTTDYSYAEEYSDYGVYTITLKGEARSKILDFSKDSDVKKLHWPRELIDDIRTGKSDLNGIAYDMYILAGYGHSQEVFDKSWHLSDAAYDFDVRSENIFDIVPKHASWASEKDHRFLLQMWKDIHDAGFDGFTHFEFGKKILALFDFKCMDKISIRPVKASLNEDSHQFYDIDKNDEVVAKCRNPIGKIGISIYDDINAAGIGSFEIFKPYHRMGHAKNVLQKLVNKLKSKYSLVYCFVDKDNYPALSLYRQLGKVSNRLNANGQYEVEFWKAAEDNQSTASKNIKNLFDEVISQYIALFGIDLSYMTFKVDSQPVYTNGEPCYEYDEDECAGDWTSLGWIRLNPDIKSVIDRYGVAWHGSDDTEEFTKIIIAHELAHEVWNNIADDEFKEEILDEARRQSFNTVYLDTVRPSKLAEETFCEYLAHKITQHSFSSIDNQKLDIQKK